MENQFTPTKASEQPSQSQQKGSKTGTIIASLIGVAVLVFLVNALIKNETGDTNENRNVGVVNGNQPIEQINSNVDTSNWKTYRNEELGFEVRYPDTWRYSFTPSGEVEFYDSQKVHYLEGTETYLVSISTLKLEDDFSLDSWMKNWTQVRKNYGGTVKNVRINRVDAVQGTDYTGVQTVFHLNGYRFTISHVLVDFDTDIYRAILTSLMFIK